MWISERLRQKAVLVLLAGATALGVYSLARGGDCLCQERCRMSFCHAFVSSGNGKQCRYYTTFAGKCVWDMYGGSGSWTPCDVVQNGVTNVYYVGSSCQAYCSDFYGSDCETAWNQAENCGAPSGMPNEVNVANYVCKQYISS